MKNVLLLISVLLLGACSSSALRSSNYSFEIKDEVISSTFEKDDDTGKYTSCTRSGKITWEIDVKPKNFSGYVLFEGVDTVGNNEQWALTLLNGKMQPFEFYLYGSWGSDPGVLDKICNIRRASQYKFKIDYSTVLMIPGVQPNFEESKGAHIDWKDET